MTSRNQLQGLVATDAARPFVLDLFTTDEARQLLSRRLGTDRIAGEPDAIDEIIGGCARLPLALAVAAAHAVTHPHLPLRSLATGLRDTQSVLSALDGGDTATDVRAVLSWSYQQLTDPAKRLFRLLGLHPGPDLSAAAAASLGAHTSPEVRSLLAELARASLIVEPTPGRYAFHDLLRAYAADLAHRTDAEECRRTATLRLLDHYLQTASAAASLLYPNGSPTSVIAPQPEVGPEQLTDHEQALAWFAAERPVLRAAVAHAAATGLDTHVWQLARALDRYFDWRGHWHDWANTSRAALAAAQRLDNLPVQVSAHRVLAQAYSRLGRLDEAHTELEHALELSARVDDPVEQAETQLAVADIWGQQGDYRQALGHAEQALHLYRATGHRRGQAFTLNAIGWYHAHLGAYRRALFDCRQALVLLQQCDDRLGQAATWDSLGYTHRCLGHHQLSITYYERSLSMHRSLCNRYEEALALTSLGDTHHAFGDCDAARDSWRQALDILNTLDHSDAEQIRHKLAAVRDARNGSTVRFPS